MIKKVMQATNETKIALWYKVLFAFTLLMVFVLSLRPIAAYDTLYTAKVGRMILENRGLPKTETLSWSAQGRPWPIHQPIAEVVLGLVDIAGGLPALSWMASAALCVFFSLTYLFFIRVCRLPKLFALGLSFFAAAATAEFFIPRAQLFAQVFFCAYLLIIYLKLYSNRNFLLWILPLSYLWANSHASFILGPYLLGSTAIASWWYYNANGENSKAKETFRTFLLWTGISLLVSILPPIGLQGWQVLVRFSQDLGFLRTYIMEWAPLPSDFPHFSFYISLVAITCVVGFAAWWRHKQNKKLILLVPLIPLIGMAFLSLRHVPFGITATIFTLGLLLSPVAIRSKMAFLIVIFLLPISLWLFTNKRWVGQDSAWFFPWQAASFLKTHPLSGRMFNEMALGSFLMYTLPSEYQVFFDGRVEMFGCCEMRDFYALMQHKADSREAFRSSWEQLQRKYQFSYALIPISSYNPLVQNTVDRIADLLLDDSQWALIYLDDTMRIFVRKDGRNDRVIAQFGMNAVTPLRLNQFREGRGQEAKQELMRMIAVTDGALAQTILGTIELENNQFPEAQTHFEKATALNPYYGLPLVGLARIALEQHRPEDARRFLETALVRSPYLGQAYLMLADLSITTGQRTKTREILQQGLNHNIDFISRRDILEQIEKLR